ncbi:MAG: hypothetical protein JXQ30_16155 [Spirochaetes bacterium]|nr:hypothetical protein [Spirochaetota bacterium]
MELTADELRFKLFKLYQDGLVIQDYEKVVQKLAELEKKTGGKRMSIDGWCDILAELEVCRGALDTAG